MGLPWGLGRENSSTSQLDPDKRDGKKRKRKLSELEVNKAGSYVKARLCMPLHGERAFGERENARCARKPGRQAGRQAQDVG